MGIMSKAAAVSDEFEEALRATEGLEKLYPCLCEVLRGQPKIGDVAAVQPGSVRLFTNGGELKFSLGGKGWFQIAYGQLPKGVVSFEAIETEIREGRVGWKIASEHKLPY